MTRNLLLVGGPPTHDFDGIADALVGVFAEVGIVTTVVSHPDEMLALLDPDAAPAHDLLTVHALHWEMEAGRYAHLRDDHGYSMRTADAAAIGDFVANGGGLLALHGAVVCFDAEPTWRSLCGAAWRWGTSGHPSVGETEVTITTGGRAHAITAGLTDFSIHDEVYGFLDEDPDLVALLEGTHGGRSHPLVWARHVGSGRVVTDLLGHGVESIDHPAHRSLLRRAALWASRRDGELAAAADPMTEAPR